MATSSEFGTPKSLSWRRPSELPSPAARADDRCYELQHDARVHAVVRGVLGFGRDIPGEIIDDEVLLDIWDWIDLGGVAAAVAKYRGELPGTPADGRRAVRRARAKLLACYWNVRRIEAAASEKGERPPWVSR